MPSEDQRAASRLPRRIEACIEPATVQRFIEGDAANLAIRTKMVYVDTLARFNTILGQDAPTHYRDLTPEHIRKWVVHTQVLRSGVQYRNLIRAFLETIPSSPEPSVIAPLIPTAGRKFRGMAARKRPLPQTYSSEELKAIIQAAPSIRDKALWVTVYASAGRISEVLAMKIRHVKFQTIEVQKTGGGKKVVEKTQLILPESKTQARTLPWMATGVAELKTWLGTRPDADTDDPLWVTRVRDSKTGRPRPLGYAAAQTMWNKHLRPRYKALTGKDLGRIHWLRHTRLTELASTMTSQELCSFAGWSQSSAMPSSYINAAGVTAQVGMNRAENEVPQVTPMLAYTFVKCPMCGAEESEGARHCSHCGAPLSVKAAERLKRQDQLEERVEWLERYISMLGAMESVLTIVEDQDERKREHANIQAELDQLIKHTPYPSGFAKYLPGSTTAASEMQRFRRMMKESPE